MSDCILNIVSNTTLYALKTGDCADGKDVEVCVVLSRFRLCTFCMRVSDVARDFERAISIFANGYDLSADNVRGIASPSSIVFMILRSIVVMLLRSSP